MKRADIKAGDELFYRRGKYGGGTKAVVVDTEKYAVYESWQWSRSGPRYFRDDRGTLILVDLHGERSGEPYVDRKAVALATLLGPWEATKAADDAAREATRAANDAEDDRRDASRGEAERLVGLAASLGLAGVDTANHDGTVMAVPPATLALLLDTYAARGA